jgi:hypothetical protein
MSDGTGVAAILDRPRDVLDLADDLRAIERQVEALHRAFMAEYDAGVALPDTLARHSAALRRLHAMMGRLVGELG